MRIAVVGSGISGLMCARLLSKRHHVTVFEANSRVGGHTNTVRTEIDGRTVNVDTGFIVYNERTYPNFTHLLNQLQVETTPTSMSFSVRCDRTGLEYNGTSLNGVFAQRRNLLRPSFLKMLADILRFNRMGPQDLHCVSPQQTVADYLAANQFSKQFAEQYLLPMGAAIWSCPCDTFARFPIRFILEFYVNHGLLSLKDRPVWRVISGGSRRYVEALIAPFHDRIRLNCPVQSVNRFENEVLVSHAHGNDTFGEVILACHSDQALRMLSNPDEDETEILEAFPYSLNTAVLHTDESLLPRRRRAWASWNYHIGQEATSRPTLTYNMNILQKIRSQSAVCVTLNEDEQIAPDKVLARFKYSHPVFTAQRETFQSQHERFIRRRRISLCGAYWRNGFHEDGVVSALAVCRQFDVPGTEDIAVPLEASQPGSLRMTRTARENPL